MRLSFLRLTAPLLALTLLGLVILGFAAPALAALDFPTLTGRVVDNAKLLDPAEERRLSDQLEQHEQATSNQIVVVTLPSLQGTTIEDFGYQLGRNWGIGQEDRNNGVLLIVAPKERKVRIEVGYGLEGDLPDAITKSIIENEILPAFRSKDYPRGIAAGVDTIIEAIAGAYEPMAKQERRNDIMELLMLLIIVLSLVGLSYFLGAFDKWVWSPTIPGGRRVRHYPPLYNPNGSGSGRRPGSGGGSGGGFSGGGGSFGGGGSSGSW